MRIMMLAKYGTQNWYVKTLVLPALAVEEKIYAIPWSRILTTFADIGMFHETDTYTFWKCKERLTELRRSKYVPFPGSYQKLFLNKYVVSTTDSWYLLAIAHTGNPIFQQQFSDRPWYALRSISGDNPEKFPLSDSGSNTEYLVVKLNILRILLGSKRNDGTSERREQAVEESRQLSKSPIL